MVDTKSVLDQIHELQVLVTKRDQKHVPQDSSKVNVVEGSKKKKNMKVNNDSKFKKKKLFGNCYNCGKKGHRVSEKKNNSIPNINSNEINN